jgi:hypothetical protein
LGHARKYILAYTGLACSVIHVSTSTLSTLIYIPHTKHV